MLGFRVLGFCGSGFWGLGLGFVGFEVGVRSRGTLGYIDPLNLVPFKRATSRVQKGPLKGSP